MENTNAIPTETIKINQSITPCLGGEHDFRQLSPNQIQCLRCNTILVIEWNLDEPKKTMGENLESEFLKAMKSIDSIQQLLTQMPDDENIDLDCCMSNMIDIKGKLKYFLNKYFDRLARERFARMYNVGKPRKAK